MVIGEDAVEDDLDGVPALRILVVALVVCFKDSSYDVAGSREAVVSTEVGDRGLDPASRHSVAAEAELLSCLIPLRGEHLNCDSKGADRVAVSVGSTAFGCGLFFLFLDSLTCVAFSKSLFAPIAVKVATHDLREVSGAFLDVVAMDLGPKVALGLVQDGKGIAAQRADEGGGGAVDVVDLVDVGEQEPGATVVGAGTFTRLLRQPGE